MIEERIINGITEWAPVIEAIGYRKHFVLIRKHEPHAHELLLVPSLGSDYRKDRIQSKYREDYHDYHLNAKNKTDYTIKYLIKIVKVIPLQRVSDVDWNQLASLFIWTPEHVKKYFSNKYEGFIWVFNLYELTSEIDLSKLKRSDTLKGDGDFYTSQNSTFIFLGPNLAPKPKEILEVYCDADSTSKKIEEYLNFHPEMTPKNKQIITLFSDETKKPQDLIINKENTSDEQTKEIINPLEQGFDKEISYEKLQNAMNYIRQLDEKYSGKPEFTEVVVKQIKRPSDLRTAILNSRGTKCQICGSKGFMKKDGKRYAETHHMIELEKKAPQTLQSWNVLVLCPLCHRKMHYADCTSEYLDNDWKITMFGESFHTKNWDK